MHVIISYQVIITRAFRPDPCPCRRSGASPGDPAEGEAIAERVAEPHVDVTEHAASALSGGVEAGDGPGTGVEHSSVGPDPHPGARHTDLAEPELNGVERTGRHRPHHRRVLEVERIEASCGVCVVPVERAL